MGCELRSAGTGQTADRCANLRTAYAGIWHFPAGSPFLLPLHHAVLVSCLSLPLRSGLLQGRSEIMQRLEERHLPVLKMALPIPLRAFHDSPLDPNFRSIYQ